MMPTMPKSTCADCVDQVERPACRARPACASAKREQHGEEQHLEDLALGEGADDGVRDDVQQELDGALLPAPWSCSAAIALVSSVAGIDVHAGAGLHDVDDDEADDQRERRDDLEIEQRLEADAADLLHVVHAGDAVHDRAEDDRRDQHLDQLDEAVAERLHLLAELRIE